MRSRCALAELKAFGGPDQPQHAHLDQVVEWHGAAAVVVDGQGTHQGALALHEPVAMLQAVRRRSRRPRPERHGLVEGDGAKEVGDGTVAARVVPRVVLAMASG